MTIFSSSSVEDSELFIVLTQQAHPSSLQTPPQKNNSHWVSRYYVIKMWCVCGKRSNWVNRFLLPLIMLGRKWTIYSQVGLKHKSESPCQKKTHWSSVDLLLENVGSCKWFQVRRGVIVYHQITFHNLNHKNLLNAPIFSSLKCFESKHHFWTDVFDESKQLQPTQQCIDAVHNE